MSTITIPTNYKKIYNSLPVVEEQFKLFKSNDNIDLLFKAISKITIPSELLNDFGLFLNHKHWELIENQIMVETTFAEYQTKGFKTRGISWPVVEQLVPVRWKILKDSDQTLFFMPLEFSNDAGAINLFHLFDKNKEFFRELADLIFKFGFESLFGMAILKRGHIVPNVQNEIYLEVSKDNESIVTVNKRAEENEKHLIPTTWSFDFIKAMECKTFCKLNTYCSTEWACWMEDSEHVRGQKHTAGSSHNTQHYPG